MKKPIADVSRDCSYNVKPEGVPPDVMQASALVRIAEALEAGVADYVKMRNELEWYKNQYRIQQDRLAARARQIACQKGIVTKLRKKLAHGKC